MTQQQLLVIGYLLSGCSIVNARANGYRLRDMECHVIAKINPRTIQCLKSRCLLRKQKGTYVIDLRTVRSLHGRSLVKKMYKQNKNGKANRQ